MFDVGASELLLIVIVAIVVIGPKDLPLALRTAGRWIGKIRRVSGHFRSGIETMIREAELEDMEKQWRAQNAAILETHPPVSGEAHEGDAALAMGAISKADQMGATLAHEVAVPVETAPKVPKPRKPRAKKVADTSV
ncbi:MAG: twin-arginine translocase subunit TatB [Pseudomonadota bacterium]|jgi:sec-independent protein translocase protein TatB